MTLPWRPIEELPVRPEHSRRFICYDAHPIHPSSWDLHWNGTHWDDGNGAFWQTDADTRTAFTHFIEITPPSAASSTSVDTPQPQQ